MDDPERRKPEAGKLKGLEAVVRLYVSRRRPGTSDGEKPPLEKPEVAPPPMLASLDEDLTRGLSEDDLPPAELGEAEVGPGEESLPQLRIGQEAAHAEAAFRLEATLGPEPEPEVEAEPRSGFEAAQANDPEFEIVFEEEAAGPADPGPGGSGPAGPADAGDRSLEAHEADEVIEGARIALLLGAMPARLRRCLLEALASEVASGGREVLMIETAHSSSRASEETPLVRELSGGEPHVLRRGLGVAPRDILLLTPAERTFLFAGLASDERLSDLVLIELELPESILSPRLQFLVDSILVGLTQQESSLYEAYRALRGLSDRRPDLEPFVIPLAASEGEAESLFERFRDIAREFLGVTVVSGGWMQLPASRADAADRPEPVPLLAPQLVSALAAHPRRGRAHRAFLGGGDRAFFQHLSDWFGPVGHS